MCLALDGHQETDITSSESSSPNAYRWFLFGTGCWFAAWGMNGVVFAWLVVEVLDAPPRWVGIAQTSSMIPAFALLLVGGAVADRGDPRRMLRAIHGLAVLPILALAAVTEIGAVTLPILLVYGAAFGTLQAFVMPARDAILPRVAGADLMRAVAGLTIFQFAGQALGNVLAGAADRVGLLAVFAAQAVIVGLGALGARGAPGGPPRGEAADARSALHDIAEGLRTVARTPELRAPVSLVAAVGVLFIGPFMVVFPLLVADVYGGGSARLGIVMMMFPLGAITGSLAIRAKGGIARKGRALLFALAGGALSLLVLSVGLPWPGFVFGTWVWGLCGSVFINTSRTLAQQAAPDAQRGRVLAAYQLGFVGSSPVGALLSGAIVESLGTLMTLALFGATMAALIGVVASVSSVSKMR